MENYFKTQEEAIKKAKEAVKENFNTFLSKTNHYCRCGESLSFNLIDSDSLNLLEKFIVCESCFYSH